MEPVPSKLPEKPKILAFYEEGWDGIYAGSWARLKEVKEKVDLISPVWLGFKADGKVNWDKTDFEADEEIDTFDKFWYKGELACQWRIRHAVTGP